MIALSAQRCTSPSSRTKKLSAEQAVVIAEGIAAGERHTQLAERFGVSVETVGAIKSGKRWASAIDDDLRERMRGSAVGGPALDAASARRVMAALEEGRSGASIATEFGISPSMVSAIKHGQAWAAIDPEFATRLAGRPREGKALSADTVALIKQRLAEGGSSRKVAEEFGVSASTVRSIAQGKTWAHVESRGSRDAATVAAPE